MAIKVNAKNFSSVIKRDLKNKIKITKKVKNDIEKSVAQPFLNVAKKYVNVGVSAALKNSGRVVEKKFDSKNLILSIVFGGFSAKYAYSNHEGTKPHKVPMWVILGPLLDWVMKKIIRGDGRKTNSFNSKKSNVSNKVKSNLRKGNTGTKKKTTNKDSEAMGISFAIANKIEKKGTKGNPFLDKAKEEFGKIADKRIKQILIDKVRNSVK